MQLPLFHYCICVGRWRTFSYIWDSS